MSTQAALPFDPPRSLVDQAFEAYIETPHAQIVRARIAAGWEAERAISTPQTYFPRRDGFHKKRKRVQPLPAPVPAAPQSGGFRPRLGGFKSYPLEALDVLRRLA